MSIKLTEKVSVSLAPGDVRKLEQIGKDTDRSLASVVRIAVRDYLAKQEA